MARYVLVSFEKDDEAETFTKWIRKDADGPQVVPSFWNAQLEGVFQQPTKFCECTPEERRGTVGARGAKYGWFVCGKCKRPPKNGNQMIFNLLENDGRPVWQRVIMLNVLSALRAVSPKRK